MAPADYRIAYPSNVAYEVQDFVTNFYNISDDPTKNEEWVSHFLIDAVLVMGPDTAYGPEEIRKLREKMWEKVAARKHEPIKVLESSFGEQETEYAIFGDLTYELKTGEKQSVTWAANMILKKVDGKLKFSYYRVYIQR
ncbi:hypothetical protein KJ359_010719 [Pestalotiopsis sp. 9143b]|nr:hypothetical protein KJ359_010719 [Pestalotiopsis sp. 9143b]